MLSVLMYQRIEALFTANGQDVQKYKNEFDAAILNMQQILLENVKDILDFYRLQVDMAMAVSCDEMMVPIQSVTPRRLLTNFSEDLKKWLGDDVDVHECMASVKIWLMRKVQDRVYAQFMAQSYTTALVLMDTYSNSHSPTTSSFHSNNANETSVVYNPN